MPIEQKGLGPLNLPPPAAAPTLPPSKQGSPLPDPSSHSASPPVQPGTDTPALRGRAVGAMAELVSIPEIREGCLREGHWSWVL